MHEQMKPNLNCFLNLQFEANVGEYELDVYAYLTNTKYKYILLKNDQHQIMRNIGSITQTPNSSNFGSGGGNTA